MPASFKLMHKYGTNLTLSTVVLSSAGIGSENTHTAAPNMSIGVPETGTVYSYEFFGQLVCVTAPLTRVTNLRSWFQYANPEGGVKLFGGRGYKGTTYNPTSNKSTLAIYDMSEYGSIGDSVTIGGTASAISSALNFMVLQLAVGSSAIYTNAHNPMIVHYAYDEE